MPKKKENLKDLSLEDLKDRVKVESERLTKTKFTHSITQIENPMTIRALRKNVARLKTELTLRNKK